MGSDISMNDILAFIKVRLGFSRAEKISTKHWPLWAFCLCIKTHSRDSRHCLPGQVSPESRIFNWSSCFSWKLPFPIGWEARSCGWNPIGSPHTDPVWNHPMRSRPRRCWASFWGCEAGPSPYWLSRTLWASYQWWWAGRCWRSCAWSSTPNWTNSCANCGRSRCSRCCFRPRSRICKTSAIIHENASRCCFCLRKFCIRFALNSHQDTGTWCRWGLL